MTNVFTIRVIDKLGNEKIHSVDPDDYFAGNRHFDKFTVIARMGKIAKIQLLEYGEKIREWPYANSTVDDNGIRTGIVGSSGTSTQPPRFIEAIRQ